eukprot:5615351-Amphidinium_carterae.1
MSHVWAAWRALAGRPLLSAERFGAGEVVSASLHAPIPHIDYMECPCFCSADVTKYRAKVETVWSLVLSCGILTVQETHGTEHGHLPILALDLGPTHRPFHSSHEHAKSARGALLLVRRVLKGPDHDLSSSPAGLQAVKVEKGIPSSSLLAYLIVVEAREKVLREQLDES